MFLHVFMNKLKKKVNSHKRGGEIGRMDDGSLSFKIHVATCHSQRGEGIDLPGSFL
jgi:hypothetical protein